MKAQVQARGPRQTCSICRHRQRALIDKQILDQVPLRQIAQQTGTSSAALHRHKGHVATEIVQVKQNQEQARASSLAEYFDSFSKRAETLEAAVLDVLQQAQKAKDRAGVLAAVKEAIGIAREMRAHRELLSKSTGELREQHIGDNLTVNVVYLPDPKSQDSQPAEVWDVIDVTPQQR